MLHESRIIRNASSACFLLTGVIARKVVSLHLSMKRSEHPFISCIRSFIKFIRSIISRAHNKIITIITERGINENEAYEFIIVVHSAHL